MSEMNKSTFAAGTTQAVLAIVEAGECAIAYANALREREAAQDALWIAYDTYQGVPEEGRGLYGCPWLKEEGRYVERDTPDWDAMMLATRAEYEVLVKAKAKVRRAHTKLLKIAARAA